MIPHPLLAEAQAKKAQKLRQKMCLQASLHSMPLIEACLYADCVVSVANGVCGFASDINAL